MKSREALRRRKKIAATLRRMFIRPDGSVKDGVKVTGIALPAEEYARATKHLASRFHGGRAGRETARANALRTARVEAWAPVAREITADRQMSRDALADALRQRLIDLDPFDPMDAELAARDDLCPNGVPSRLRFRQIVSSLTEAEWTSWTLHLPDEPVPMR